MKKADWHYVLMSIYDWDVRYLIEMKGISGKVPFGIYSVLTDKESVMQLLCTLMTAKFRQFSVLLITLLSSSLCVSQGQSDFTGLYFECAINDITPPWIEVKLDFHPEVRADYDPETVSICSAPIISLYEIESVVSGAYERLAFVEELNFPGRLPHESYSGFIVLTVDDNFAELFLDKTSSGIGKYMVFVIGSFVVAYTEISEGFPDGILQVGGMSQSAAKKVEELFNGA